MGGKPEPIGNPCRRQYCALVNLTSLPHCCWATIYVAGSHVMFYTAQSIAILRIVTVKVQWSLDNSHISSQQNCVSHCGKIVVTLNLISVVWRRLETEH